MSMINIIQEIASKYEVVNVNSDVKVSLSDQLKLMEATINNLANDGNQNTLRVPLRL